MPTVEWGGPATITALSAPEPPDCEAAAAAYERATMRARERLCRYLPEDVRRQYEYQRYLLFTGSDGARYQLRSHTYSGNITRFVGGRIEHYCAHPYMYDDNGWTLPIEDVLLCQYLALVHDAPGLLAIANAY